MQTTLNLQSIPSSYNPDNTGARTGHAIIIKSDLDFKTSLSTVLSSFAGGVIGAAAIAALFAAGFVTGGAGFLFLAGCGAVLGGGAVGAGVAFFSDAFRTRQASRQVFEALVNPKNNFALLTTREIKATVEALEQNKKYALIDKLFRAISAKQAVLLMQEPEQARYDRYLPQNPLYQEIMSGNKNIQLLRVDPYYRALYEALMAKNTRIIDTDVFELDFPNVAKKMSESIQTAQDGPVFDIVAGENRLEEKKHWHLFKCLSPQVRKEAHNGKVSVRNVQDFTQVMRILEMKAGILTRDDFETAISVAEELGMQDLKQDLVAMASKRKDLFSTREELESFIETHSSFRWSETD